MMKATIPLSRTLDLRIDENTATLTRYGDLNHSIQLTQKEARLLAHLLELNIAPLEGEPTREENHDSCSYES